MSRIKVGTQRDETLYRRLKVAAARERRPVAAILEEAVAGYLCRQHGNGLVRLLEGRPAFEVTEEQFRASLESEPYDP